MLGQSRKAAPSERCPNCGEWFMAGDCRHTSHMEIKCEFGGYSSTLYGVCSECARKHAERGE